MDLFTESKIGVEGGLHDDTELFLWGGNLTTERSQAFRYAWKHGVGATLMNIFVLVESSGWHEEAMLAIW